MSAAEVLSTLAGLAAIGVACRDIFDSVPPGGARGRRQAVSRLVWPRPAVSRAAA